MVAIAARQTTRIKASMTAYSTAVGPLSSFRNRTRLLIGLGITGLLRNWDKKGHSILEQRMLIEEGILCLKAHRQSACNPFTRLTRVFKSFGLRKTFGRFPLQRQLVLAVIDA
jgi:hypothetical protein